MVARSGAGCQMSDDTKTTKQRKVKRNSDQGEETERTDPQSVKQDPQSVKQEERSDAGKQLKPSRRVEEGVPNESKRKTAVAVVDAAAPSRAEQAALLQDASRPPAQRLPGQRPSGPTASAPSASGPCSAIIAADTPVPGQLDVNGAVVRVGAGKEGRPGWRGRRLALGRSHPLQQRIGIGH